MDQQRLERIISDYLQASCDWKHLSLSTLARELAERITQETAAANRGWCDHCGQPIVEHEVSRE